jgi:hypothetical protein
LLKLDIEGSEIEALKGMRKTLESDLQLAISAYHPVRGTISHEMIIPHLKELGFRTDHAEGIVQASKGCK